MVSAGDPVITRAQRPAPADQQHRLGQERRPLDRHPRPRRRLPDRRPRQARQDDPPARRLRRRARPARLRHHRPRRPGHHHRHLPRRPDRRRGPQPALRRALPRPLRQPPLPRRRLRRRPAQPDPPRGADPAHRARPARRDPAPRRLPGLRDHHACASSPTPPSCSATLAARYHDALTTGAENLIGPTGMDKIDAARRQPSSTGLTDAPAWPTLRSHLALLALDDHNPLTLLTARRRTPGRWPTPATPPPSSTPASTTSQPTSPPTTGRRPTTRTPLPPPPGPLPWLPGIPARLADNLDWGPYLASHHQLVRRPGRHRQRPRPRLDTAPTAPAWAQPFLEDEDTDLRADLAVWRAVTDTPDTDLRPTGDRTIGAPGDHQTTLNRAVREARPSYPFAQRSWYQALPETVRVDPWITPLCQRLARLERAGLPVTDYLTQALETDPTNPTGQSDARTGARPLPDEHQAAALWWRLVPHLGPAALDADAHSANLLQPAWRTTLTELVGARQGRLPAARPRLARARRRRRRSLPAPRLDPARHPRPPALAASPKTAASPASRSPTRSCSASPCSPTSRRWPPTTRPRPFDADAPADPDLLRPEDADDFMAAFYRDMVRRPRRPGHPLPHPGRSTTDLDAAIAARRSRSTPSRRTTTTRFAYPSADDPYLPTMPWQHDGRRGQQRARVPRPRRDPGRADPRAQPAGTGLLRVLLPALLGAGLPARPPRHRPDRPPTTGPPSASATRPAPAAACCATSPPRAPPSTNSNRPDSSAHRERNDGTTDYIDFFRDRLVMPIRDPHDPTGQAVLGFLGRRNPTKSDDDYAGPKYLNTKTTPVFTKGEALFGYAEAADAPRRRRATRHRRRPHRRLRHHPRQQRRPPSASPRWAPR